MNGTNSKFGTVWSDLRETEPSRGWREALRMGWLRRWLDPAGAKVDQAPYRRLALQLSYDLEAADTPPSLLIVTPTTSSLSPHATLALSRTMADELQKTILLVDAWPRGPGLSHLLGANDSAGGFTDLVDGGPSLASMVCSTNDPSISLLPAGRVAAPRGIASSANLQGLLEAAQSQADFVLISAGSVLDDPAALALAPWVGAVLLLVIENETRLEDLQVARDVLTARGSRRIGVALTRPVRAPRSGSE